MIGKTNAVVGGSNTFKVLNVAKTGTTLKREGSEVYNFANTNYLQAVSRVDNGILSIGSSPSNKDFSTVIQSESFELVWKLRFFSWFFVDNNLQGLFANGSGTNLTNWCINKVDSSQIRYRFETNGQIILSAYDSLPPVDNTTWLVKFSLENNKFGFYRSVDGTNWTVKGEVDKTITLSNNSASYIIGNLPGFNLQLRSILDLEGCYIKVNGEYWWKGVEKVKQVVNNL